MSQDARVIAARQWWLESLAARAETLRAGLSARSGGEVAARAGAHWEETQQRLTIPYWGKVYTVAWPMLAVYDAAGQPARPDVAAILLSYLERADGEPAAGRCLSFRELPDAGFYHQAFDSYTGQRLASAYGTTPERLAQACQAEGGEPIAVGDVGFAFVALPRLRLAVAFWEGDDEMPAQARVLFDAAASHYLDAAGLAGLGGQLTGRLLRRQL